MAAVVALLLLVGVMLVAKPEVADMVATSDSEALLPERPADPAPQPKLLVLAIDGMDRDLLYRMLRGGQLPALAELLGGAADGRFPHAYFAEGLLSTLPSSTIAAWATVITGAPPAVHGVPGNEYFVREAAAFEAPAGVSVADPEPVLSIYTDQYANRLLAAPTVYERMRTREHGVVIWSSMLQFFEGADRLLTADRTILTDAFAALIESAASSDDPELFEQLDEEAIDTLLEELDAHAAPDVVTLYLCGNDHYAHTADAGPDRARERYLREVLDPLFGRLHGGLRARGVLDGRAIVLTSDHGHTEVLHDEAHALSTDDHDDPPAVVRAAGFRLRPFELEVDEEQAFDTVLAYQGAMAFAYVADRSTCRGDQPCDWRRPPRYEEDVLPLAEAFYRANLDGRGAPGMRGTLDMVLTRRPVPFEADDAPFEVYVGDGQVVPLAQHLRDHPHPTYVAFEERLRDLAVGRYGERAGDVLLLAHNGDRDDPAQRYYFAGLYRSWHGSPSRKDSEIPLIVADPSRDADRIERDVRSVLGDAPRQQDVARLLEALRYGSRALTSTR